MKFLRELMESRPYFNRIRDESLIVGDAGKGALHIEAARDTEGSYAFVYFPINDLTAKLDLTKLRAKRLRAWWYDPRTGVGTLIGMLDAGPEVRIPIAPLWSGLGIGTRRSRRGISTSRVSSPGSSDGGRSHFGQFNILSLRQAAHRNRTNDTAVIPNRDSPAPSSEPGIAEIADIEALLRITRGITDLFGGLAFAGGAVGLVHRDGNGRKWRPIHAGERNQITMRIANGDDALSSRGGGSRRK